MLNHLPHVVSGAADFCETALTSCGRLTQLHTPFKLNVFADTGKGLIGEFSKVENAYMYSGPSPEMKCGASEKITGSDVEQIAEKAKVRIQDLGHEFSRWIKEKG